MCGHKLIIIYHAHIVLKLLQTMDRSGERYVGGLLLEKLWMECKRSDEDKLLELVKREM